MCGCRSSWPNHSINLFPLSLLSTIIAFYFSTWYQNLSTILAKLFVAVSFVLSPSEWLFLGISAWLNCFRTWWSCCCGCSCYFGSSLVLLALLKFVVVIVAVRFKLGWCVVPIAILVWVLLKYCCRCCWNCCWRCCDCKGRCSFLLWVAVCSVDYQGLCRFKAYSTFLLLQQLFVGVWATRSVDSLCLCRFKAYSTFFILQQLFVGV